MISFCRLILGAAAQKLLPGSFKKPLIFPNKVRGKRDSLGQEVESMQIERKRCQSGNDEVIDTLIAISLVSKRLAKNMAILAARKQVKGGCHDEQDKRTGHGHYRVVEVR